MSARSHDPSRREFVAAGAAVLISAAAPGLPRFELTAQQATDRIRANAGVPWRETTVDTFKAGDPRTVVTGIATTVMATLPVLRQAAAAGPNLTLPFEPTFFNRTDDPATRATTPVHPAHKPFNQDHRLVIWRFAEHWGARVPNEF